MKASSSYVLYVSHQQKWEYTYFPHIHCLDLVISPPPTHTPPPPFGLELFPAKDHKFELSVR